MTVAATVHRRLIAVVAAVLIAAWSGPASAAPETGNAQSGLAQLRQMQDAFAAIAEKVAPSVVAIQTRRKLSSLDELGGSREEYVRRFGDRLVPAVGSGIIIESAGYVLTNAHVVESSEELVVILANRHRFPGKVIGSDPRSDLAIIKIEAKDLRAARLGDLASVRQGHWAIAMGNPFGLAGEGKPAMTVGVISAVGRALPNIGGNGDRHYGNLIQTSADINPGNSGGPLLNLDGEVIGVNTVISSRSGVSEGVGFAVPITSRTRSIIETLKAGQKVEYGFLGVAVRSPQTEESTRAGAPAYLGAVVDMVEAGTPAAKAGIRGGDIIVSIDDDAIEDSDHLVRSVGGSPIGKPVRVTLWRDKQKVVVPVVLEKRSEMLATHSKNEPDADRHTWRGLTLAALSEQRRKALGLTKDAEGVEVVAVADPSPAQAAGLKVGDVVVKLDGKAVKSLDGLRALMAQADAAKDAVLTLTSGATRTVKPAK